MADIFASADVHTKHALNIQSFIISLSLAYLFGVVPTVHNADGSVALSAAMAMTAADQEGIRTAFATSADMFLLFDEDAGGTITLDEVRHCCSFIHGTNNNKHGIIMIIMILLIVIMFIIFLFFDRYQRRAID